MVTSYLTGGLGNYLFQIAAAVTLAYKNNDSAVFDFTNVGQAQQNIYTYITNILRNVTIGKPVVECTFKEASDFSYSPIPYRKNILLQGYFQSEKYINRELILELFSVDNLSNEYISTKYNDISDYVSIHVRRGDYLKKSDRFPACNMDYYSKAISLFPDNTKFLVFGDDKAWLNENFQDEKFVITNEKDYIDLYLMSMCAHNIIANSSFSWWASFLNKNKHKRIIAPRVWFGPKKPVLKSENIYSPQWEVV